MIADNVLITHGAAMIRRFGGSVATRSNVVIHDGVATAVATAPSKSASLYEQTKQALALLDANLAKAGLNKTRVLSATIYITDMHQKPEMNRAWDEWVDRDNPPVRACIGATLEADDLVEIVVTAAAETGVV
jgi:enamine deaminase RidA (YjgF/YER057c/UK114 family)